MEIPDEVLDGVRFAESNNGKYLASSAGAYGPYGFKPATAREYGVKNVFDEADSREGARRYLSKLADKFGSIERALQAYNWGPGNIRKHLEDPTGHPMPKETTDYAPKVLGYKATVDKKTTPAEKPKYEFEAIPEVKAPPEPKKEDPYNAAYNEARTTAKEGIDTVKQELAAVPHALGDIPRGMSQLSTHLAEATGQVPKGASKTEDEAIRQREIAYQKTTPKSSGAFRALPSIALGAATGGESLAASLAGGAVQAATQPVTDTEDGFFKEKGKQLAMAEAPAAVLHGGQSLMKYALRGGKDKIPGLIEGLNRYKRAGVPDPTLGQVSAGGLTTEAGAFPSKLASERAQIGDQVQKVAGKVSSEVDPEQAGAAIAKGIAGDGQTTAGWLGKFRDTKNHLYEKVDKLIPPSTPVKLDNTLPMMKELATTSATAPATSGVMMNQKMVALYHSLLDDSGAAKALTYADVKTLRSKVGEMIDSGKIDPSINVGDARKLYATLSTDMDLMAVAVGPRAVKAMETANRVTHEGHTLIEKHLQPVLDGDLKHKILNAALEGKGQSGERIQAVLDTLDPVQQDAVKAVVLQELGRDDLAGRGFNATKFVSNWSRLHPTARTALFGKEGSNLRTSLDAIAKTADEVKLDSNILADQRNFAGGGEVEVAASAAVPHKATLGKILLSGGGIGFLSGRMIKDPAIMRWLAQASTRTPGQLNEVLAGLAARSRGLSAEDKADVDQYIENVRGLAEQEAAPPAQPKPKYEFEPVAAPAPAPKPVQDYHTYDDSEVDPKLKLKQEAFGPVEG